MCKFKQALTVVVLIIFSFGAIADDFDDGVEAIGRKDYSAAFLKFKKAATQNNTEAQYRVGLMYELGAGVLQDYDEAVRWYRLAAANGSVKAYMGLGVMYDNGQGVKQNYIEAVHWYRLAAANNNKRAQTNLGAMYSNGTGLMQDFVKAHMWFNLAAIEGEEKALKNRDYMATVMSMQQIAEAQKLARECQSRNFKNCD